MRWPQCFVVFLLLLGSRSSAQCTADHPAHFERPIGETHLECDYLPDKNGDTIRWQITKPDVTQQLTEYRDITFNVGDQVLVSAEGCVDVSPDLNRHDWRRYVDPQGSNTDRFFHGLIWIPGASVRDTSTSQPLFTTAGTGPVRISSISGVQGDPSNAELLTIQAPPLGTLPTLRLGYEVDYDRTRTNEPTQRPLAAYAKSAAPDGLRAEIHSGQVHRPHVSENGQCKGEPAASVTILIKRAPQNSPAGSQVTASESRRPTRSLLPFDPVSPRTDENGFMLSPLWYGNLGKAETSGLSVVDDCKNFEYKHWLFVRYGVRSPCAQAASFDVPPGLITECTLAPGFGQLHGHVNWTPVTFMGKLRWRERSADRDQDLQLKTLSDYDRAERFAGNYDFGRVGGILTLDSQTISDYKDALWLEFASYETVDVFPSIDGQKSWQTLLAENEDHTAIVTGLLTLDCVHECHTELHPVLALAVRTSDETNTADKSDDSWAIFLRNSGNEGDCSADAHYLSRDSYTFFLPAPKGATRAVPEVMNPDATFTADTDGISWSISEAPNSDGPGALVQFSFAPGACVQIHSGRDPVQLAGTLKLNWNAKHEYPAQTSTASDWGSNHPVIFKQTEEHLKCPANSENVLYDDLTQSEKRSVEIHRLHPPCKSPSCLMSALGSFFEPREFGVYPDILLYNKTSQVEINPGFRYSLVQTALGSFEIEGSPGLSRSVRSTNGANLTVRISDLLYGIKLRFPSPLNIFGEAKGGMVFRSAGAGYSATPDFYRFSGHDSLFLIGGGIEPGKPARTFGLDISIRISADYLYLPGTGEHLVRLTIGPQFQIPRRNAQ